VIGRAHFSIPATSTHEACVRSGSEREMTQCRLDFGAGFHLDGSVPADDQVTSLSPIGGNDHHGPVAFTTTHSRVALEAQGESAEAQEALEKLCRRNIPRQTPSLLKLPLLQIGIH
jgi:hypothetical protein